MRRILVVSVLLAGILLSAIHYSSIAAFLAAQEMPLNPDGAALEINADAQGNLWISDYLAGQIWQLAANGSSRVVYTVPKNPFGPGDAGPDNQGGVWWVDGTSLNRLKIADSTTQMWNISNSSSLWGLAFGAQGQLWLSDVSSPNVYRVDPVGLKSYAYTLPNGGLGHYGAVSGTQFWLGDFVNGRLLRIDSGAAQNTLTWWALPTGSTPQSVALDSSGNVWYTDNGLGQIGSLNPVTNALSVYTLPGGQTAPSMLAIAGGKIWYTGQSPASIGTLDPSLVSVTPQEVLPVTSNVTPPSVTLDVPQTGSASSSSAAVTWSNASYTSQTVPNGWSVFQMPVNAQPTGIALTTSGFVVDSGRQVLARFLISDLKYRTFIPSVRH